MPGVQSPARRHVQTATYRRAAIYSCIRASGADVTAFLQGQLTQDIERLAMEPGLLAAWCTSKGRVFVTLRVIRLDGAVGLIVPSSSVDLVLQRLKLYRLRSKVDLEVRDDLLAAAFDDDASRERLAAAGALPGDVVLDIAGNGALLAVRLAGGAIEVYGAAGAFADANLGVDAGMTEESWHAARILAGLVEIDVSNGERFTPHMLNLDCVDAISFVKGCYTGQEVVARTQHLGKVKRRANLYRIEDASVTAGNRLRDGDRDVAEVVNAAADVALAVAPVERHGHTLAANGGRATPLPLPYDLVSGRI